MLDSLLRYALLNCLGLRGAVAFALALHMDFGDEKTQRIMLATTLAIVLFTIVVLGGGTMPLMKVGWKPLCHTVNLDAIRF